MKPPPKQNLRKTCNSYCVTCSHRLCIIESSSQIVSSQILSPWLGDIVNWGMGLSSRPTKIHRLAGRCNIPMPWSRLYSPVRDYEFGSWPATLLVLHRARIFCRPFKEPGINSQPGGIESWAPYTFTTTGSEVKVRKKNLLHLKCGTEKGNIF